MNDHNQLFTPMLKVYPQERVKDFMFMGRGEKNGTEIYFYKHYGTRGYIYIDATGQTYNDDFRKVKPEKAMNKAVEGFYDAIN